MKFFLLILFITLGHIHAKPNDIKELSSIQDYLALTDRDFQRLSSAEVAALLDRDCLKGMPKGNKIEILRAFLKERRSFLTHSYIFHWLNIIDGKTAEGIFDDCIGGKLGQHCVEQILFEEEFIKEKHVGILEKFLVSTNVRLRSLSLSRLKHLYKLRKNGAEKKFADWVVDNWKDVLFKNGRMIDDEPLLMGFSGLIMDSKKVTPDLYLIILKSTKHRATQSNCLLGIFILSNARAISDKKAIKAELSSLMKKGLINLKNQEAFDDTIKALGS